MADVSGTWLGTYWQGGIPYRFETTLLQSGNTVTGNILDDSYLGEALLSGEVIGLNIQFMKRYLTTSPQPVSYTGTLTESEDFMQGQWRVGRFASGPWEARRGGADLMANLEARLADRVPVSSKIWVETPSLRTAI